jgi:hypothetical protein
LRNQHSVEWDRMAWRQLLKRSRIRQRDPPTAPIGWFSNAPECNPQYRLECPACRHLLDCDFPTGARRRNTTFRGSFYFDSVFPQSSISCSYQRSTCVSSRRFSLSLVQEPKYAATVRQNRPNPYKPAHAAGPPRTHVSLIGHEPGDGLSTSGDDDLLGARSAIDKARQVDLGFMKIDLHEQRLATEVSVV